MREKLWYFLVDSKTNQLYSNQILKKYQKFDLYLNVFLVIAASSSIGAWVIWQKLPYLWAVILGVSQLFTIIKPYLLFQKYIKVFSEKSLQWQYLTIDLEEFWYNINYKKMDEDNVSHKFFELKKKAVSFDNIPDDIIFFNHNKQLTKAEEETNIYLKKI
ncbi:hypothetical protein [Chondrinema litorale]|uniref:hypothetical protein n=1 Tax=Chondrinema litorale TaxID=2994555 RepID=UPI0025435DA1|nr:hypothetical protein [Chondrinema litorale]UZS00216.1 hypothetical protein OQ292_40360 [Chondrinema litorale]